MGIGLTNATKLRGGYYTPSLVAEWLARWAIRSGDDLVLEPSCGEGVFLTAATAAFNGKNCFREIQSNQIMAIELMPEEADKARILASRSTTVITCDFFDWLEANMGTCLFDVVLGNPPFIRYQNFPEPSRSIAMKFLQEQGFRPNRLTNIWVPFVVGAMAMLREGGRLAMVIPAELLQVTYAGQLRQRLANSFRHITIYACNEMFFDNAEQEVVLLLAEGKTSSVDPMNQSDISLIAATTVDEVLRSNPRSIKDQSKPKNVQHSTEKWLKYFLDAEEIDFIRALREEHDEIGTLGDHAAVDVGVVTGNNRFFVLNQHQVDEFNVADFVIPLVGRSSQLSGAVLKKQELISLAKKGKPVYLLHLTGRNMHEFTPGLRRMIAEGERREVQCGYKCSIRKPWYNVPSVWEPDCFFFRQIYDFPRIVINKTAATSTDTIHRIRCTSPASKIASNVYTHLTAASAEIEGRSYGGGVLELEPTEAERLMMPRVLNGAMPIEEADRLVRTGRIKDVLEHNDKIVLRDSLGLSVTDCRMLMHIGAKMRDRRMSRRRTQ